MTGMSKNQTVLQLKKIASVPYLYRHESNFRFYGVKKHEGKIVRKALKDAAGDPIINLQEAKEALAEWLVLLASTAAPNVRKSPAFSLKSFIRSISESSGVDLAAISPAASIMSQGTGTIGDEMRNTKQLIATQARAKEIERDSMSMAKAEVLGEAQEYEQGRKEEVAKTNTPTLAQCFDNFLIYKNGVSAGTLAKYKYVKRAFELHGGKVLLKTPIAKITPQTLAEFLVKLPGKPQSFNTFSLVINQVFEMVRINRNIKENPFDLLPRNITHHKVQLTRDVVPTIKQCEAIVASIRSQRASDTREDSSNLCEFIHLAALGQAEAGFLTWADIDFEKDVIRAKRIKTGKFFDVPIYPHLKPFLEALAASKPNRKPADKLFKIESMQKALYAACQRLKLPNYSPRDLRKARITWLLRKGYPVDLIAEAQGHSDGGVLVRRVYSNVIDEARDTYRQEQLAKLR